MTTKRTTLIVVGALGVLLMAALAAIAGLRLITPADLTFEEWLKGEDLARYQSLPPEFQAGLIHAAGSPANAESSIPPYDSALARLRALPTDVRPLADILPPEEFALFSELSEENRALLALDVYSDVFGDESASHVEDPAALTVEFAMVVLAFHKMAFGDGEAPLPPMEERLSDEAMRKLDAVAPVMRRAFTLLWRNLRATPEALDATTSRLESALLAAPTELEHLERLGLSQSAVRALETSPNLRSLVEEYVAAELVYTGSWDAVGSMRGGAALMEGFIARASTPEGSRMFEQGLLPRTEGQPPPLLSHFRPALGMWPLWAVPPFFRGMQPGDIVLEWPDYRLALSAGAPSLFPCSAPTGAL